MEIINLGLGFWQIKQGSAKQVFINGYKAGYHHFDTAIVYRNEKEIGEAKIISNQFRIRFQNKRRRYEKTRQNKNILDKNALKNQDFDSWFFSILFKMRTGLF